MTEKRFVEWIPIGREHRPYDTTPHIQRVSGCYRCLRCFPVGRLTEYPRIGHQYGPRQVCDSCLELDKRDGTFDAIMDIWDNFEEKIEE